MATALGAGRCLHMVEPCRPRGTASFSAADDGAKELDELYRGIGCQDDVDVPSIGAVDTEMQLAPLKAGWVIFPTGTVEFGRRVHGNHQL